MTLFEELIDYCEDSFAIGTNETIKSCVADFFDIHNRVVPLLEEEIYFIDKNISENMQRQLFGTIVKQEGVSDIRDIKEDERQRVVTNLRDVYDTGCGIDNEEVARFENAILDAVEYLGFDPGLI